MSWFERNTELLGEVQTEAKLRRGPIVGTGSNTIVTSLGSYFSSLSGRDLYLCLKVAEGFQPEGRAISDLSFIRRAAFTLPHLEPEFPILLGVLKDSRNGEALGVLTEDFSQARRLRVSEVFDTDATLLPRELLTLVGTLDSDVADYELAKICFLVHAEDDSWQRRLGDFGSIRVAMIASERLAQFPIKDLIDDPSPYTVTIDYDL